MPTTNFYITVVYVCIYIRGLVNRKFSVIDRIVLAVTEKSEAVRHFDR